MWVCGHDNIDVSVLGYGFLTSEWKIKRRGHVYLYYFLFLQFFLMFSRGLNLGQVDVWRDETAAWPVANPVLTCASVSDAGFPSNFVADPFLYVQVTLISSISFRFLEFMSSNVHSWIHCPSGLEKIGRTVWVWLVRYIRIYIIPICF